MIMRPTDIDESKLGGLNPGYNIPRHVRIMLIEAGYDPNKFTPGEMIEIINACADGRLVEDHSAQKGRDMHALRDQMEETMEERAERLGLSVDELKTKLCENIEETVAEIAERRGVSIDEFKKQERARTHGAE